MHRQSDITLADFWGVENIVPTWNDNAGYVAYPFVCEIDRAYTITYNANGGSGTIDPVIAAPIVEITLNDGSDLTPPSDKVFSGWGTTDDATDAVEGPIKISEDTALYAIWADESIVDP